MASERLRERIAALDPDELVHLVCRVWKAKGNKTAVRSRGEETFVLYQDADLDADAKGFDGIVWVVTGDAPDESGLREFWELRGNVDADRGIVLDRTGDAAGRGPDGIEVVDADDLAADVETHGLAGAVLFSLDLPEDRESGTDGDEHTTPESATGDGNGEHPTRESDSVDGSDEPRTASSSSARGEVNPTDAATASHAGPEPTDGTAGGDGRRTASEADRQRATEDDDRLESGSGRGRADPGSEPREQDETAGRHGGDPSDDPPEESPRRRRDRRGEESDRSGDHPDRGERAGSSHRTDREQTPRYDREGRRRPEEDGSRRRRSRRRHRPEADGRDGKKVLLAVLVGIVVLGGAALLVTQATGPTNVGFQGTSAQQTGEEAAQTVTGGLDPVSKTGTVTDRGRVATINVTLRKAPGAADVNLSGATAELVGPDGVDQFALADGDVVSVERRNGEGSLLPTSPVVLDDPSDRVRISIDLTASELTNGRLGPGEEATLRLHTAAGATTSVSVTVPKPLSGRDSVRL